MHGLPDQSLEEALDDLRQAIASIRRISPGIS
jgi:coproporphyrinogen III oxidase-like Fe-S oxidoreductase